MSDRDHSYGFSCHPYTAAAQMLISTCPLSSIFSTDYTTSPRCAAGHSRSIDPKRNSSLSSKLHSFLRYKCRFTDPPSPRSLELKPSKASSAPPTSAPSPSVQSVGQVLLVFPSCCLWYLSPHPHCHGIFIVHHLDSCRYYLISIPYDHASLYFSPCYQNITEHI